ncbi:MAG: tRNA 2-thiouridine(34) synthase MnmA, partial [Kiritimatiellae bacterium]|nr:tRNA 2-thiouridine(34) synthase MnmA [Kiritimatiellia bacterium]
MKKEKIIIGLSGGVDSTLTALLLQKMGFDVIGVILKLHKSNKSGIDESACGGNQSIMSAQISADELGIPLHIVDCSKKFENRILKRCWKIFESGATPNPCYSCNALVKFVELLNTARCFNAEKIATGHYARIDFDTQERPVLKRGLDKNKDQSYFLSGLPPSILKHTLFPLGSMQKEDVKRAAKKQGLSSSTLKESQDLCFAGPE